MIELKERLLSLQASYECFIEEHQSVVANTNESGLNTQNELFEEVSEQRTTIAVRIQTRIQEIEDENRRREAREIGKARVRKLMNIVKIMIVVIVTQEES